MFETIFLICLALIWMIFAAVEDLKKREIANWVNFSLIIFALGFRFFWSLFSENGFQFFYQGLVGLAVFFVLGNFLYYGRMFAGGDAKLFFALGAILPFSSEFLVNINIFALFLVLFLFSGAFYGLFISIFLISKNFKRFRGEFLRQLKLNKKLMISMIFLSLFFIILGISNSSNYFMIYFAVLIFVLPYLYLSAKSVDESCMVKKIHPKKLTEGDWLYRDVKVGRNIIRKSWSGLTKKDIKLLQKKKFVWIRQGIAFSPVFLIAFLVLVYLFFSKVWLKLGVF